MSRTNIICIGCPKGCRMEINTEDNEIKQISGYSCAIGKKYAREEFFNPTRILPTTVKVVNGELPLVPVKTSKPIPKEVIFKAMQEIATIEVEAPIEIGQVIRRNFMGLEANLVATRNINEKLE